MKTVTLLSECIGKRVLVNYNHAPLEIVPVAQSPSGEFIAYYTRESGAVQWSPNAKVLDVLGDAEPGMLEDAKKRAAI